MRRAIGRRQVRVLVGCATADSGNVLEGLGDRTVHHRDRQVSLALIAAACGAKKTRMKLSDLINSPSRKSGSRGFSLYRVTSGETGKASTAHTSRRRSEHGIAVDLAPSSPTIDPGSSEEVGVAIEMTSTPPVETEAAPASNVPARRMSSTRTLTRRNSAVKRARPENKGAAESGRMPRILPLNTGSVLP